MNVPNGVYTTGGNMRGGKSEMARIAFDAANIRGDRAILVSRHGKRVSSAVIDGWLDELVSTPLSAIRRARKHELINALIADGLKASNARVMADKLIAERRQRQRQDAEALGWAQL